MRQTGEHGEIFPVRRKLFEIHRRLVIRARLGRDKVGRVKAEPGIHRHKAFGRGGGLGKGGRHGAQERQGHSGARAFQKGAAAQRGLDGDETHVTCSGKFRIG